MAHRYPKIRYTDFKIPDTMEGNGSEWCYSARDFEGGLKDRFEGQKLVAVYVELRGYLEGRISADPFDLLCDGSGCILIIGESLIELGLHAEGQFRYRILPLCAAETRTTKDYPPNGYYEFLNCYFNINDLDTPVTVADQEIQQIEVKGTDMWCFNTESFDSEKAQRSADKKDLPAEIVIRTDDFTVRLLGDCIEYYHLILERQ